MDVVALHPEISKCPIKFKIIVETIPEHNLPSASKYFWIHVNRYHNFTANNSSSISLWRETQITCDNQPSPVQFNWIHPPELSVTTTRSNFLLYMHVTLNVWSLYMKYLTQSYTGETSKMRKTEREKQREKALQWQSVMGWYTPRISGSWHLAGFAYSTAYTKQFNCIYWDT